MPNFRQQAQALAQQLTIAIAEARYWQQQAGQRMAAADQRQREALRTLRRARPLGRHQRKLDRSGTRRLCGPLLAAAGAEDAGRPAQPGAPGAGRRQGAALGEVTEHAGVKQQFVF